MTQPLTENPAIIDPLRRLTAHQRDCLLSIDFYRIQRRSGGFWQLGPKHFAVATVTSLEAAGLVRRGDKQPLALSHGGQLVVIKIKGAAK